ncbi:HD-GYP domain-containing protein [Methylobacterium oryzisoli]|uniref:HD-GYP domain-containing protein n=1 Tax=Methylobacterium oryzisoli TaxID=3385502 RepID=UPI0038916350
MTDGFILLVSDDPKKAHSLAHSVTCHLPCRVIEPGQRQPPGTVLAVLLDVALDDPSLLASLRGLMSHLRARMRPCLCLARDLTPATLAKARALGASRILPPFTSRAALSAALLDLVQVSAAERAREPRVQIRAQAVEACALVTGLFDAAESGRALSHEDVEAGTEIVLDAISEAGIQAWLETIWSHQSEVYQHSLSVAGHAAVFASVLGFRRSDQHRLARAALLHDVGKAKIPRAILAKPSSLTPDELAIMRTHPAIGADLLAAQPGFDAETLGVVRHHHELLDGSGYPDGLRGGEIPDLVRLVTICDIYSALTERRPYRAPLNAADAWVVMEGMGGKLDTALLNAFRSTVGGLQTASAA